LNSGTPLAAASSSGLPLMNVQRTLNVTASESGESYDVVSSGNASPGIASPRMTSPKITSQPDKSKNDADDPDSDWE
jgi:hypothetical protein